ncbi:recombinase family protein [Rhizobium skierniewicense]|uniref:recombinase family protein n=1 Tax=Rhizobium skierniewicense TaxID=984260 RepID=UPI003D6DC355
MNLLDSIVDKGVSAFTGDNLNAGLGAFIESVKVGAISSNVVLLIENLDRFSRMNPMDVLPAFTSALATGLTIVTLHDELVHTNDLYRDNVYRVIQSLISMQQAHEESKKKSDRLKGAWSARVGKLRAGHRVPISKPPLWIDPKTQEFNDRVDDAREIFRLAVDGHGASAITRMINEKGIPSSRGGTWGKSMVQLVLKSKAAYGSYVIGDHEQRDYFPALISETTWIAIENRARRQRNNPQAAKHANLFPRLLYCGGCGAPMDVTTTSASGKKYKYASCSMRTKARNDCKAKNWPFDAFEKMFVDRIAELLDHRSVTASLVDELSERERLQIEAESLTARQEDMVNLSMQTDIKEIQMRYLRGAEDVARQIAQLRTKIAGLVMIEAEREAARGAIETARGAVKEANILRRENRPLLKSMISAVVRSITLQSFDADDINVAEVELRSGHVTNMVFEEGSFR